MTTDEPLATAYLAPFSSGLVVLCLFGGIISLLVALGGALSGNAGTGVGGAALTLFAAGGLVYFRRRARTAVVAQTYADRLEFLRGPQRGVVPFQDILGFHSLEWGRSFFPYSRGSRVLVLKTASAEWQVGPGLAEAPAFQDAVTRAVTAFHAPAA